MLSLFRSHWLAVVYRLFLCIGSCVPVHEDRTHEGWNICPRFLVYIFKPRIVTVCFVTVRVVEVVTFSSQVATFLFGKILFKFCVQS